MKQLTEIDNSLPVQIKLRNSCTSGRRQSDNHREVLIPAEVILPFLPPWVEEPDRFHAEGIITHQLVMLFTIAAQTGVGEIVQACSSAF